MKRVPAFATILALAVIAPTLMSPGATAGSQLRRKAGDEPTLPSEPGLESASTATPTVGVMPGASLSKTIEQMRKSAIGNEPNAVAYLDLIGEGRATPAQANDFAAYVAKRGLPKIALAVQEYAVRLDPNNATLWANLGTIRRTNGSLGPAAVAFKKAIAIDPANALAHYNLGAVYDADKNYDAAIDEYRRALVLDPELADPRKNPQVVNNENLLAVKLQIYSHQAGSLGLPLLQMQKNAQPAKAAPDKP
jgi:tetratricopeptide (TPR) repeat protein